MHLKKSREQNIYQRFLIRKGFLGAVSWCRWAVLLQRMVVCFSVLSIKFTKKKKRQREKKHCVFLKQCLNLEPSSSLDISVSWCFFFFFPFETKNSRLKS